MEGRRLLVELIVADEEAVGVDLLEESRAALPEGERARGSEARGCERERQEHWMGA